MNTDMSLEKIDTSYWLTKDKSWVEERQAQWSAIEKVIGLNRRKSEVDVIKQYFLRGKMPNWEKYRNWDGFFRHLDLNIFLWLHPSNDSDVLKNLYKIYMESNLIHEQDVINGYGSLIDHELLSATMPYESLEEYPYPFRGSKNVILFRVMFDDIEYAKEKIYSLVGGQEKFNKKASHIFEFLGYQHFLRMRLWLLQDIKLPLCAYNLYQYDDVLGWCLTTLTAKNEKEFLEGLQIPEYLQEFQKALYCIHCFDTEKEGDTCRTYAIHKIRKILDERTFVPEFKKMWEDTKAGKIEVKTPWKD